MLFSMAIPIRHSSSEASYKKFSYPFTGKKPLKFKILGFTVSFFKKKVAFQLLMVYIVRNGNNNNISETIGHQERYRDRQQDYCLTSGEKQTFHFSRSMQAMGLEAG